MDVPAELIPWLELLLKMAVTAAVVVAASVMAERSGPFLGAMIASLPTAAGAAYVILALEHPPPSSPPARSAAWRRWRRSRYSRWLMPGWREATVVLLSLGTALVIWLVRAVALRAVNWTLWSAGAAQHRRIFRNDDVVARGCASADLKPPKMTTLASDIALRAASTAVVVAAVTAVSDHIGPFFAGVFALFPVVMAQPRGDPAPRIGGAGTANVLANVQAPAVRPGDQLRVLSACWSCRWASGGHCSPAWRSASPGMRCCCAGTERAAAEPVTDVNPA